MSAIAEYSSKATGGGALFATANTARDGTGTLAILFTPDATNAKGGRVDSMVVTATGTTTAGMVRLFVHTGVAAFLLKEVPVLAVTPSAAVPAFTQECNALSMPGIFPLVLPPGFTLRASTHNAESFHAVVNNGGSF